MSSSNPPFGNAAMRPCLHCKMPIPFNKVYCRNCGGYNTPELSNYSASQPPSGTFLGGVPSTNNDSNSVGAQQWQPPAARPNQPDLNDGFSTPQQPSGSPNQPFQLQRPAQINYFSGTPGQQPPPNNFSGAPVPPPYPQPTTNAPGSMHVYSSANFNQPPVQPMTGGLPVGSMGGYPPADFAQPPKNQHRPSRHIVRIVVPILLSFLLIVAVAIGGIGVYFSNAILDVVHYTPTYTLAVTNVSAKTVTLQRTSDTLAQGEFEIEWPAGEAIVGPLISSNVNTVTRQLLQTTGPLSPGMLTYWTRNVYAGKLKDSLKLTINDVQVPDPLGAMPAWYVPGKLTTWVVLVHGQGETREEALRVFQPLAHIGLPLLAISYRNDLGSPASPDGYDHLGDTEWQDLEAGVKYALAHGAKHLILFGWSKGGATVEAFEHRSTYAPYVQALVLDAPILDWRATFTFQAQKRSLPGFIATVAESIVSIRSGTNFNALDQFDLPQRAIPILLFHGTNDTSTPIAVSDEFASVHTDFVTYERVPHADHTESWNADPQSYDNELTAFLTQKLHL